MDVLDKLAILTDAAKYDVACTSSGVSRKGQKGMLGSAAAAGICHSFASDGRCISLLKVLMTNYCIYDCKYCVNRCSEDVPRAAFTPEELAELTVGFYRRNYIEGLFLSSAVIRNPDYTCEQMIRTLALLRGEKYRFNGYIHVKAIPGADERLLTQLGYLADRVSINVELPSEKGLKQLAPDKSKASIFKPMRLLTQKIEVHSHEVVRYRHASAFAPAGQSTQMIIGATPDTDFQIMQLSEGLYQHYALKRVFYSAYIPVSDSSLLPSIDTKPPLLREHRLYQADWLLRFYGFTTKELLSEEEPQLNPHVDPKCGWALRHPELFPVEVNKAPKEVLLRVPGIGVKSVLRILQVRRYQKIDFQTLKKIGVVLKRARYFILCDGKRMEGIQTTPQHVLEALISEKENKKLTTQQYEQLSFFDQGHYFSKEVLKCLMQ